MEEIFWSDKQTRCFTLILSAKHLEDIADDLSRLCLEDLDGIVAKIDRAAIHIRNVISTRYDDCEC